MTFGPPRDATGRGIALRNNATGRVGRGELEREREKCEEDEIVSRRVATSTLARSLVCHASEKLPSATQEGLHLPPRCHKAGPKDKRVALSRRINYRFRARAPTDFRSVGRGKPRGVRSLSFSVSLCPHTPSRFNLI